MTDNLPDIPCVILAGGGSQRFGSAKGLAEIDGKPLISLILSKLQTQTRGPIAINAPKNGGYQSYAETLLPDKISGGFGPLAGIHTAMSWAGELDYEAVITTPVDLPFLPEDYVAQLLEKGAPAIAKSAGSLHPVCGIWPTSLAKQLEEEIAKGMRAAYQWAEVLNAQAVAFENRGAIDPFFNINTSKDLADAQAILERSASASPRE